MHTSLKRKFVEFVYKYKNLSLLTKNAISIKDVMEIAITRVRFLETAKLCIPILICDPDTWLWFYHTICNDLVKRASHIMPLFLKTFNDIIIVWHTKSCDSC